MRASFCPGHWVLFLVMIGCVQRLPVNAKPLHHHMTDMEIQRFFGVHTPEDVPEYEITEPYQSNKEGDFVSHTLHERHTRDTQHSGEWHYKMDAFGKEMHLKLRRNTQLVKPGLELETRHANGEVTRMPLKSDWYFHGTVSSDPGSLVAISNDKGLTGMIRLSDDTFFVHPLPNHLANHVATKSGAKPHLVYRKSVKQIKCHSNTDSKFESTFKINDARDVGSSKASSHKYLKVGLLADENVAAKHGNNTADFLLILANIVAGMFRDNSIGKIKVTYVVSRLMIITNKELNVNLSSNNLERMAKLNGWIEKHKPRNKSDPDYFEVAALVHVGHRGGRGLSGGLCYHRVVSNVNGYAGLQTAAIIAHETGHNFGAGHDGDNNCKDGINIMSTYLTGGKGALKWSKCTSQLLQDFLRGPGSKCLDDPPSLSVPTLGNKSLAGKLPGFLFNADTQCKFIYGDKYRQCPDSQYQTCAYLYCARSSSVCKTINAPPADGTSCGPRNWCIKGKCVDNGLPRINGGWSEWSDYSPCSRTCGGGVQYRERTCTDPPPTNGGKECSGESKAKWKICNSQNECPLPSFRDVQCKKIDPNYPRALYYENACYLACSNGWEVNYYGWQTTDGDRCYNRADNFDICIEGKCRVVGCDHVLESGKRKDRCGICDGKGESCILEKSSYTREYWRYGFDKPGTIVVLPVGAANARFKQKQKSYNVLGIQDNSTGEYIITHPTWSKIVHYNGTRIAYIHEDNKYDDEIIIDGPTTLPLRVVFIFLYERNGGVDFQYYRPLMSNETPQTVPSEWMPEEWSPCSMTCAQGVSTRVLSCVRSDDGTPASVDSCPKLVKPETQRPCNNNQSCSPEWHLTDWSECSRTCGNGSHFRLLYCRRQINELRFEKVDDSLCQMSAKPNETLRQRCNEISCPAEWRPLPWNECSSTCSGGVMTRKLQCIQKNELGNYVVVAKEVCRYAMKPGTVMGCNDDIPCDPPPEIQVACFVGSDHFKEILGDFTNKINWNNTNEVAKKCAKLAYANGYTLFALGKNGLCLSGADMKQKYYTYGTYRAKCRDGIGISWNSMFVYSLEPMPNPEPVGCFWDYFDRALPDHYANFRDQIMWKNMHLTVNQCARVAQDKGYEYFAVQYYGECYGGKNAENTYNKYGKSTYCWKFDKQNGFGVGRDLANFVYRIKQGTKTSA